jgi:hypothetical protein
MPPMVRRAMRVLLAAAVLLIPGLPAAAVTFGPQRQVSGPYSWNPAKSLAASSSKLLAVWATDCPPPKHICAIDSGPHMGVFVRRSGAARTNPSWSAPTRLSRATTQAERPSIAAHGSTVIASWVTQRSYLHYRPARPRVLWVRVSTSEGKRWRPPVRITAPTGRVDYPRVAVGGGRLFVTWTNANTGDIRLAWSDDLGGSWTRIVVGTTTAHPMGNKEGYAGFPDVGASGTNVAVAWIADAAGEQDVVTSAISGDDLAGATPAQLTATSPNDGQHYPAVQGSRDPTDGRIAIAYSAPGELDVVTFDGATLGPPETVFAWGQRFGGVRYSGGYGPAALPLAPSGLAVAVAGCRPNLNASNDCNPLARGARIDVVYRTTADSTTWDAAQRLTSAGSTMFRVYDEPSLAMTGVVQRVSYDRYVRSFARYDVALRSGS